MPKERESNNKNKAIALALTVVVHALVVVGLLFIYLKASIPEAGGGIMVNIGDAPLADGMFMPHQLEPDFEPQSPEPAPVPEDNSLLTQEDPEAPVVQTPPDNREKEREAERQRLIEQRKIEEQRRRAEEEAQRKRDAIRKNVSGAFGNTGTSGSGTDPMAPSGNAGSPQGNVNSGGVNAGVGGFGSFSLDGRGLAPGTSLQRPNYSVQEEGVIVISITVNPEGRVIQALIGPGTTIVNNTLRNSSLKAAKATRFNAVDEINNQVGTITYRFQLK
ncbi:MAG: energy transducer TonB [Porphyromonas sp.]|nr:energy transducer TonB [Porphyromonas sp.]